MRAAVDLKREGADLWPFEAFLWLPTDDHQAPNPLHLQMGLSFLRRCEEAAIPVFVNCMMGVGRSASLVLAHLLVSRFRGANVDEALAYPGLAAARRRAQRAHRSRPRWKRPATSPGRRSPSRRAFGGTGGASGQKDDLLGSDLDHVAAHQIHRTFDAPAGPERSVAAAQVLEDGAFPLHADPGVATGHADRPAPHDAALAASDEVVALRERDLPAIPEQAARGRPARRGPRVGRRQLAAEGVAEAVDGSDEARLSWRVLQSGTEVGHEAGESGFGHEGPGPEHLADLGLREGAGAPGHEQAQEVEGFRLESHGCARSEQLAPLRVQGEVSETQGHPEAASILGAGFHACKLS